LVHCQIRPASFSWPTEKRGLNGGVKGATKHQEEKERRERKRESQRVWLGQAFLGEGVKVNLVNTSEKQPSIFSLMVKKREQSRLT